MIIVSFLTAKLYHYNADCAIKSTLCIIAYFSLYLKHYFYDERRKTMTILREIGIIARALDSIANIEFRDLELARGQYLYLVRIGEEPGIIQEELSDRLKVDRSTVARSVKKLADKGLIEDLKDNTNQKTKQWFLTEKGKAVYPFILAEHQYSEKIALEGFSKEEAIQLEKWLAKVRMNVAADWGLVKKGQKRNYSEEKK